MSRLDAYPDEDQGNESQGDQNAGKSVSELEADIARTRSQLGRDVEDFSYKLSPDRFKEQTQNTLQNAQEAVMESVSEMTENLLEKTKEAGGSFTDMIRRHPLPTALIGAGVALLAAGGGVGAKRTRDDSYPDYSSRYGYGEAGRSGDTGSAQGYGATRNLDYGAYDSGYDTGSHTPQASSGAAYGNYGSGTYGSSSAKSSYNAPDNDGQSLGDQAGSAGAQAKRQAAAAGRGLAGFIEDQPLIAGLVTIVLGAVIGLSLPGTRQEDELMGNARDQFAEQARGVAERAKEVAQKTFDEAKETAKQEFGKVQEDVKEAAKNISETAKQEFGKVQGDAKTAAKNVSENVKQTAKDEADKEDLS